MRTEQELKYLLSELIQKRDYWLKVVKQNYRYYLICNIKDDIPGERELDKYENQIEIVRYALGHVDYLS